MGIRSKPTLETSRVDAAEAQDAPEASDPSKDLAEVLRRRARRMVHRGDLRKAILALRQLAEQTGEARHWVMLGDLLVRARRHQEGLGALRQALWLHRKAGAMGRARTVAGMVLALDPHDQRAARIIEQRAA